MDINKTNNNVSIFFTINQTKCFCVFVIPLVFQEKKTLFKNHKQTNLKKLYKLKNWRHCILNDIIFNYTSLLESKYYNN